MGLFSGRTEISVSASSMQLMDQSTDKVRDATIYAIMKGQSITQTIMDDALLGGIALKAERAYKYGYQEYSLGLPTGSMTSRKQLPDSVVEGFIEDDIGQPVTVLSNVIDNLSYELSVYDFLKGTRGYNSLTGAITNYPFSITGSTYADYPVLIDSVSFNPTTNVVTITYAHYWSITTYGDAGFTEDGWEYFTENVQLPREYKFGEQYCIATYQRRSPTTGNLIGGEEFWYYRLADNTYPALVRAIFDYDKEGFYPMVPLRRKNDDLTTPSHQDGELYKTSKKLLNYLGLDIHSLADALNENPDSDDIDHAYVVFGLLINTENEASIRYLTEFFDWLGDLSKYDKDTFDLFTVNEEDPPVNIKQMKNRSRYVEQQDATIKEMDINLELLYNYINSRLINGSIGPVGTATSHITGEDDSHYSDAYVNNSYITFKHQIEENVYKQVIVHGLIHHNDVYRDEIVSTTLKTVKHDPDEQNFIIPLHHLILRRFNLLDQNKILQDGLRLQIQSYEKTKVKWYASNFFKFLVMAVAVAMTVISGGGAGGFVAAIADAAAVGAMALIQLLLEQIILGLIVSYGFKLVTDIIGAEFAAILGAAMAITGLYMSQTGMTGTITAGSATMPTADALLAAGNSLISASGSQFATQTQEIADDMADFAEESEEKMDMLEEASKILDVKSSLNPLKWVINEPKVNLPWEKPAAFYERTIHTGNPGVKTLDVIRNFHDNMLMLPKQKPLILK